MSWPAFFTIKTSTLEFSRLHLISYAVRWSKNVDDPYIIVIGISSGSSETRFTIGDLAHIRKTFMCRNASSPEGVWALQWQMYSSIVLSFQSSDSRLFVSNCAKRAIHGPSGPKTLRGESTLQVFIRKLEKWTHRGRTSYCCSESGCRSTIPPGKIAKPQGSERRRCLILSGYFKA